MAGLLEGIKVVEATVLLVGDFLGALLGDEGADVVKIEQPGVGDYARKLAAQLAPGYSPMHVSVNRNKRSLTLDPTSAPGAEVFGRLVETADVFMTSYVGDVPAKLGMDYESVRAIRPDIVYCRATGFGSYGPYANIPTHGTMMEALGAAPTLQMSPTGRVGQVAPGLPVMGVIVGPLFGAYAIAAALVRRERTGRGSCIDISASDAVLGSAWPWALARLNPEMLQPAVDVDPGGGPGTAAKYGYYQTSDGKYLLFCCIERKFWQKFCDVVGRPDLRERHSTVTVVDFGAGDLDLMDELQQTFSSKTLDEWIAVLRNEDLPIGPAIQLDGAANDRHVQAREMIIDEHHPAIGDIRVLGNPVKVAGETFAVQRHAPALGEHTDEILRQLGYSSDTITALREAQVV